MMAFKWRKTLRLIGLWLALLPNLSLAQESIQEVRNTIKRIVPDQYDDWEEGKRLTWIAKQLETATAPTEIYVLNRILFWEKMQKSDFKAASRICQSIKHVVDDFSFRSRCIDAQESSISHEEARRQLFEILQDAKRFKRPTEAVEALSNIAWLQSQDGDISEALANYGEALEMVPKEDERLRFNVLFNLATNYIIHGNDEYIQKGIGLLTEIKTRGAERGKDSSQADASLYLADSQLAAFNIGIANTLHLHEYEKAIPEFQYAKGLGESNRVEALTFSALAASEIGKFDMAKQFIKELKGESSIHSDKESYLKCYRALAIRRWDPNQELTSCFNMNRDTTLEVLADIYKRLAKLKGQPEELEGLRAYVKMYEEKIEPEYKKRAAKAASNTELKRLETEAKLKDEKIALGEKIKILLYAVMGVSVLLLGMVLVVLRGIRIMRLQAKELDRQKQKLQHVLDNIDEGILSIDRHARISPVYSRYSTEILGKKPDDCTLPELLMTMGLSADAVSSGKEVFHAVMGEDEIAWDLNEGLLPMSGEIRGDPFQFHWTPIIHKNHVNEIILSIRDASATLALQKEAKTRARLLAVVNSGNIGHNYINDLSSRVSGFNKGLTKEGALHCLRLAHTTKGEARSLGFKEMQDILHHFEQSLLQEDFARSKELLIQIEEETKLLGEALNLIKSSQQGHTGNPIMNMVQTVLGDANRRLQEAGLSLVSDIHLNWVNLSEDEIGAMRDVLVHGIANSIDHGYLIAHSKNLPVEKMARLSIQLHEKGDDIHFSIIDHGVGIDWKALEEIARKRNWTPPKDSDLADIVFFDKVSTVAEIQVSKTSGRGIGLAAVAEAVKTLNGSIKFGPGFNHRGARLDIKWNHQKMVEPKVTAVAS